MNEIKQGEYTEKEYRKAMDEMNIWEVEKTIKNLPEAELRQVYELVDNLLQKKYGARMHL